MWKKWNIKGTAKSDEIIQLLPQNETIQEKIKIQQEKSKNLTNSQLHNLKSITIEEITPEDKINLDDLKNSLSTDEFVSVVKFLTYLDEFVSAEITYDPKLIFLSMLSLLLDTPLIFTLENQEKMFIGIGLKNENDNFVNSPVFRNFINLCLAKIKNINSPENKYDTEIIRKIDTAIAKTYRKKERMLIALLNQKKELAQKQIPYLLDFLLENLYKNIKRIAGNENCFPVLLFSNDNSYMFSNDQINLLSSKLTSEELYNLTMYQFKNHGIISYTLSTGTSQYVKNWTSDNRTIDQHYDIKIKEIEEKILKSYNTLFQIPLLNLNGRFKCVLACFLKNDIDFYKKINIFHSAFSYQSSLFYQLIDLYDAYETMEKTQRLLALASSLKNIPHNHKKAVNYCSELKKSATKRYEEFCEKFDQGKKELIQNINSDKLPRLLADISKIKLDETVKANPGYIFQFLDYMYDRILFLSLNFHSVKYGGNIPIFNLLENVNMQVMKKGFIDKNLEIYIDEGLKALKAYVPIFRTGVHALYSIIEHIAKNIEKHGNTSSNNIQIYLSCEEDNKYPNLIKFKISFNGNKSNFEKITSVLNELQIVYNNKILINIDENILKKYKGYSEIIHWTAFLREIDPNEFQYLINEPKLLDLQYEEHAQKINLILYLLKQREEIKVENEKNLSITELNKYRFVVVDNENLYNQISQNPEKPFRLIYIQNQNYNPLDLEALWLHSYCNNPKEYKIEIMQNKYFCFCYQDNTWAKCSHNTNLHTKIIRFERHGKGDNGYFYYEPFKGSSLLNYIDLNQNEQHWLYRLFESAFFPIVVVDNELKFDDDQKNKLKLKRIYIHDDINQLNNLFGTLDNIILFIHLGYIEKSQNDSYLDEIARNNKVKRVILFTNRADPPDKFQKFKIIDKSSLSNVLYTPWDEFAKLEIMEVI